jgi:hypothetical protein
MTIPSFLISNEWGHSVLGPSCSKYYRTCAQILYIYQISFYTTLQTIYYSPSPGLAHAPNIMLELQEPIEHSSKLEKTCRCCN